MTVPTTNIVAGPYIGNDVTTTFDYNWKIWKSSQLSLYVTDNNGVVTRLTEGVDYRVNGIGSTLGRTVTLTEPLPSGHTLLIRSNFLPTQETDFVNQGSFYPQVHEDSFDKLTYLIQQLLDSISRSLVLPEYVSGVDGELPPPVPGAIFGWNEDGTGVAYYDNGASVIYIGGTPPSPDSFFLWYDTANHVLRYYDGSGWVPTRDGVVWDFVSTPAALPDSDVLFTVAHGLSSRPTRAEARAVCRVANNGYSPGDEVLIASSIESFSFVDTYTAYRTLWVDDNNVGFSYHGALYVAHKTTPGAVYNMTGANWDIVLRASL